MRLPVEAVGVCEVVFAVVGFGAAWVGSRFGILASRDNSKKMSFNFCISMGISG